MLQHFHDGLSVLLSRVFQFRAERLQIRKLLLVEIIFVVLR